MTVEHTGYDQDEYAEFPGQRTEAVGWKLPAVVDPPK
jgi:hypothetical protein